MFSRFCLCASSKIPEQHSRNGNKSGGQDARKTLQYKQSLGCLLVPEEPQLPELPPLIPIKKILNEGTSTEKLWLPESSVSTTRDSGCLRSKSSVFTSRRDGRGWEEIWNLATNATGAVKL